LNAILLKNPPRYRLRAGRNKKPGDNISTTGLNNIVEKQGNMVRKPRLQLHDLRRTYAEFEHRAGVSIEQSSTLLSHATRGPSNPERNQDNFAYPPKKVYSRDMQNYPFSAETHSNQ